MDFLELVLQLVSPVRLVGIVSGPSMHDKNLKGA